MQVQLVGDPGDQPGQCDERRVAGAAGQRESVCAGEGFEEERILRDVTGEDLAVQ
ncbi:hypothetical protein D3C83_300560 [compost metagenome]